MTTRLHLGCGSVIREGWLNIDLDSPQADLKLDLRQPLPFDPGSMEFIFAERVFEHLAPEDGLALLLECRRVLGPDGVLRLSTPNLEYLTYTYLTERLDAWGASWRPATPCLMMNEGMRAWGHEFLYDLRDLVTLLSRAGFADVQRRPWGASAYPPLKCMESRPYQQDLIVEAAAILEPIEPAEPLDSTFFTSQGGPNFLSRLQDNLETVRMNELRGKQQLMEAHEQLEQARRQLDERATQLTQATQKLGVLEQTYWLRLGRKLGFIGNKV